MGSGNNLETYKIAVENAKQRLQSAKSSLEQAKRGGNYDNALKNNGTSDGRKLNSYDYAVYEAEKHLKECEERLAKEEKRVKG